MELKIKTLESCGDRMMCFIYWNQGYWQKLVTGGQVLIGSRWWQPLGIKTQFIHDSCLHIFLWMQECERLAVDGVCNWITDSHSGRVKGDVTNLSGEQKQITWQSGKKRRLALSIQHRLTPVLTNPDVDNNTGLYLVQGDTLRLHPQPVSSRWASVTRGDDGRRLSSPEHCTSCLCNICILLNRPVLWLQRRISSWINQTFNQSIRQSIIHLNCPCWEMYDTVRLAEKTKQSQTLDTRKER